MRLLAVSVDDITTSNLTGWDIGLAVASLVVAWLAGRYARKVMLDVVGRVDGVSDDLRELAGRSAKYFCWLIGVGVALGFLGAEVQPLLAAVLIIAVIAALAIRGVADNFAAGVVIQTRRPVHIGDEIESLEENGIVRELTSRAVVIETFDGRTVHLPNAKVLDEPLANHTSAGARRAEVEVRVQHTGPTDELRAGIADVVGAADGVLPARPITVMLAGTDPERTRLVVRYWHHPQQLASSTTAVVEAITDHLRDRSLPAAVAAPIPPPTLAPPATV